MPLTSLTEPIAAEVRQDVDSEAALIETAKQALSTCNWKIGECASQWTDRYARGRTDADFGAAVGASPDQVYKCRRVHDTFGSSALMRKLSWTHFFAALNWDDAESCLQWAYANQATVSEMKSWKSAQAQSSENHREAAGNGDGDPFASDTEFGGNSDINEDPFGEGTGEEDGTEAGGTDSTEEPPPRTAGRATEAPGGKPKPPADPVVIQRSKAVKTVEALMRAVDDLHVLKPLPRHEKIMDGLRKMLETLKSA